MNVRLLIPFGAALYAVETSGVVVPLNQAAEADYSLATVAHVLRAVIHWKPEEQTA